MEKTENNTTKHSNLDLWTILKYVCEALSSWVLKQSCSIADLDQKTKAMLEHIEEVVLSFLQAAHGCSEKRKELTKLGGEFRESFRSIAETWEWEREVAWLPGAVHLRRHGTCSDDCETTISGTTRAWKVIQVLKILKRRAQTPTILFLRRALIFQKTTGSRMIWTELKTVPLITGTIASKNTSTTEKTVLGFRWGDSWMRIWGNRQSL